MKLNKAFIGIVFLLTVKMASAQQDPQFTFYRYNMNLINPAFAGSHDGMEFMLGIRSQWAGIEGAPETQNALFSMPMGNNVGLGISVLNDQTFIERQTWLAIDFSYKLKIDNEHELFLGIKGSGNSYNANTAGLVTYGISQDGSLMEVNSRFTPNVGIGAYWKHERYFISLSAPKVLTPDRLEERNGNAFLGTDRRHVYLAGGYNFNLGKNLMMETTSMLRYVDASPLSIELTGIIDFGQKFKLGGFYRIDAAVGGLFLFDVSPSFKIGYAYGSPLQSSVSNIDNGTHEVFMRIAI